MCDSRERQKGKKINEYTTIFPKSYLVLKIYEFWRLFIFSFGLLLSPLTATVLGVIYDSCFSLIWWIGGHIWEKKIVSYYCIFFNLSFLHVYIPMLPLKVYHFKLQCQCQ